MRSDKKLKDFGNLIEVKITPKVEELDKIEENYILKVKEGKLEFEENPRKKEDNKILERTVVLGKIKDGTITIGELAQYVINNL